MRKRKKTRKTQKTRKTKAKKKTKKRRVPTVSEKLGPIVSLVEVEDLRAYVEKLLEVNQKTSERVEDLEIHVNLLTRLLTTLCIEKFGMRVGVLKRMIKRIEKEAIRDSQILHLESLYKLPSATNKKKGLPRPQKKNDPWDDIA